MQNDKNQPAASASVPVAEAERPGVRHGRHRVLIEIGIGVLAVLLLLGYMVWVSYRSAINEAEITTRDFAALLEARLDATLRRSDANLLRLKRTFPQAALNKAAVPRYAAEWNAEFDLWLLHFPELAGIRIFDAHGDLLYTSDSQRVARANVADLGHFQRLRDSSEDRLEFSDVLLARTSRQRIVSIARGLRDGQGVFLGMVAVTVRLDYFVELFQSLDLGDGGNVAVYRSDDFRLVVRWPQIEANFNKPLPADSPTRAALADGRKTATLQVKAAADGRTRIYGYHVHDRYPFFVSVGIARDTALEQWRNRSLTIGLFVLLLVAALVWLLLRMLRAEASLARLNEELEKRVLERTAAFELANRELEAFSYSISHDLRTPLRGIAGIARILEVDHGAQIDAMGRKLLVRMRDAAKKMGELIEDLLRLSRLTRSDMVLTTVDLSALAAEIVEVLRAAEPERRVTFVAPPRLEVQGDRNLLGILLENLLGNAWKFTAKHATARIELGVLAGEGEITCFVRDDGAGFDQAHAAHLFAPFHRLHRDEDFPGTGIGLATVQRIIQRHGGRIRAEGAVEKGATFYFTLPS